jgi:hypothetical protein
MAPPAGWHCAKNRFWPFQ